MQHPGDVGAAFAWVTALVTTLAHAQDLARCDPLLITQQGRTDRLCSPVGTRSEDHSVPRRLIQAGCPCFK
jgi:hypothetical protein